MSVSKKMMNGFVGLGMVLASLSAHAGALTVVNNTDYYSTVRTNNGTCSSKLRDGKGITRPHDSNTIPESTVNVACITNRSNCKADVYMTADCSGPMIAVVIFDVKSGIKSVSMIDSHYRIGGSGFYIQIDRI